MESGAKGCEVIVSGALLLPPLHHRTHSCPSVSTGGAGGHLLLPSGPGPCLGGCLVQHSGPPRTLTDTSVSAASLGVHPVCFRAFARIIQVRGAWSFAGKLRAQRAKAMKFKDGYMISSGFPVCEYIDGAVRHVMLRQGVLGIKVHCPTHNMR